MCVCCDDDGAEKFRTLDDDVDDELLINACGVSTVFLMQVGVPILVVMVVVMAVF